MILLSLCQNLCSNKDLHTLYDKYIVVKTLVVEDFHLAE